MWALSLEGRRQLIRSALRNHYDSAMENFKESIRQYNTIREVYEVLSTQFSYIYTMHTTHICRLYPNLCYNTLLAVYIEIEGGQSTGDTEESYSRGNDYHWSCHQPETPLPTRGSCGVCGGGCRDP